MKIHMASLYLAATAERGNAFFHFPTVTYDSYTLPK